MENKIEKKECICMTEDTMQEVVQDTRTPEQIKAFHLALQAGLFREIAYMKRGYSQEIEITDKEYMRRKNRRKMAKASRKRNRSR
jgi:hypothetical protein